MKIKRRVDNLVKKCGTKDLCKLCEYLKIKVIYAELGSIKGFYNKTLTNKFIVINESLNEFGQKVVLAHELGHAVLHNNQVISLKAYELAHKYSNKIETEANTFAAYLLHDITIDDYEYNLDIDLEILEKLKKLIK